MTGMSCADAHRADVAGPASQMALDLLVAGKAEGVEEGQLARLDFIEGVVAANEQQEELLVVHDGDGLDGLRQRAA
jgi:hypothetical protein